ncbi:MAG: 3-phosphoshikimate 1-carboxyvinyltransferase [Simkaniaceae bacterium]|nr:3-phosphoshikimate 1-carboxyvinyltransferase [Candidatus Sacchlamyda saccharinae]
MQILPTKNLKGQIAVPPSKSHCLRAVLFAMLGSGVTRIENVLKSPDLEAMLDAISLFGAKVEREGSSLAIEGHFKPASDTIDAGNSGQVLRFIGAIAALLPSYTMITGDASIRSRRPVKPLLTALRGLGVLAESALGDGHAPITVRGPMHSGTTRLNGEDSQPVSGLLIATSFLDGHSEIVVDNPGETPWIDLTLDWIRRLGGAVTHENYSLYRVKGGLSYSGFTYTVPGDFSTAAFPIAAALITGSHLEITGLDPDDVQGDKELITILQSMGAQIRWEEKRLIVEPSKLKGLFIDVNTCIDALPILAVIGCFADGVTTLYNGKIAREKESDRISAICTELKKMGAHIQEEPDGLVIQTSTLNGADLESYRDHRIALSLAVAALGATSPSKLSGAECIQKTYPNFAKDFSSIGALLELDLIRL